MARGIIYCMSTIVPGLVKIGKTGKDNFEQRMYNLEHNGYVQVVGLKRRFAIEVDDYDEKETLIHELFSKSNVPNTELFAVDIELVVQLLSSLEGTQVFPKSISKKESFDIATDEIQKNTYYMTKKQIVEQVPKSGKVLCTSRFIGVYVHYGEYIPVFKIGSSMYWVDNAEQQVRDYLAVQIFATPIRKAIFLIEDYDYEAMRLVERPEQRPNWGQSLRDSLELSSCYRKVFLFTDDKTGVEQLRLFRSYAMIEERFLDIVFEDDEKNDRENSIVNGYIDDKKFIVLFSGDIINIKRLRRMLENGLIDYTFIVCYDFQEKFLREAFHSWRDRVTFRSFSLEEVIAVCASFEAV